MYLKIQKNSFLPVLVPLVSWKVITIFAVMPVFQATKDNIVKGMSPGPFIHIGHIYERDREPLSVWMCAIDNAK